MKYLARCIVKDASCIPAYSYFLQWLQYLGQSYLYYHVAMIYDHKKPMVSRNHLFRMRDTMNISSGYFEKKIKE